MTQHDIAEEMNKGHGRLEHRRLECSWPKSSGPTEANTRLAGKLDWPHFAQACRIERRVTEHGKTTSEISCAITSLSSSRATAAQLLPLWRGHWGIENGLHWVRDVVFREDASRYRTDHGPQVMAAFRNTVLSLLRRWGWSSATEGIRHFTWKPADGLSLLGIL